MIEEFGPEIPLDPAAVRVPVESREEGLCRVRDLIGGLMAAVRAEVLAQLEARGITRVLSACESRAACGEADIVDVHVRVRLAPDYLGFELVPRERRTP